MFAVLNRCRAGDVLFSLKLALVLAMEGLLRSSSSADGPCCSRQACAQRYRYRKVASEGQRFSSGEACGKTSRPNGWLRASRCGRAKASRSRQLLKLRRIPSTATCSRNHCASRTPRGPHQVDLAAGWGAVAPLHALERKYRNAIRGWAWLRAAAQAAGICKPTTCRSLPHSFATHLLEQCTDILTIQGLLDRSDVKTTMIDTHVLNRDPSGVRSPADLI